MVYNKVICDLSLKIGGKMSFHDSELSKFGSKLSKL